MVLLVAAGALVCFSAPHAAAPQHDIFFDDFSLTFSDRSEAGARMTLRHKGTPVPGMSEFVRWGRAEAIEHDECRSMWFTFATDGVSCCLGNYVFTSCGKASSAFIVDGDRYDVEKASSDLTEKAAHFVFVDTAFKAYEKSDAAGGLVLSFSFGNSPVVERLLVFDGKRWRADEPGRFPEFYEERLAETSGFSIDDDADAAGKAITGAYQAFFIRGSETLARVVFDAYFPQNMKTIADAVFADVMRAARKPLPENARRLIVPPVKGGGPAAAAPASFWGHTVRKGETVYSLGRFYGVRPQSIIAANPQLASTGLLKIGDVVRIPKPE